jgi:osmoprotectant transport system permease protein
MNYLTAGFTWLNDPLNWTNPNGLLVRLEEHLLISALAVLIGCVVGWPLGLWLGHRGRGGGLVITVSNLTLAVPTVALLTILPLTPLGFGKPPIVIALAVFAVPPLLANAYTGVRQIDPETRDAARGMGLSGRQVLTRVELPLAVPYLAAGLRTASVQVVATAALAAFVNGGGLGQIIGAGFGIGLDNGGAGQIVGGALVVAVLALTVEGLLAGTQRLVTPRGLRATARRPQTVAPGACGFRGPRPTAVPPPRAGTGAPAARRTRGRPRRGRAGTQKAAPCVEHRSSSSARSPPRSPSPGAVRRARPVPRHRPAVPPVGRAARRSPGRTWSCSPTTRSSRTPTTSWPP